MSEAPEGANPGPWRLDHDMCGQSATDRALANLAGAQHGVVSRAQLLTLGFTSRRIEHHQGVMARADWIIDLGPGAGHDGGRIVFEGTPADLVAARSTVTGEHLADYVGR